MLSEFLLLVCLTFRSDHFKLYSWIITQEAYLWGKTNSSSLSSYSLPVALHVGLSPCEISPVNVGMSVGIIIIQVFFRQL